METLELVFKEENIFSCLEELRRAGVTKPEELYELTEYDLSDLLGWSLLTRRRVMNAIAKMNGLTKPEPSLRDIVKRDSSLERSSSLPKAKPPTLSPVNSSAVYLPSPSTGGSKYSEMRLCDLSSLSPVKRDRKQIYPKPELVTPKEEKPRFLRTDISNKGKKEQHSSQPKLAPRSSLPNRKTLRKHNNIIKPVPRLPRLQLQQCASTPEIMPRKSRLPRKQLVTSNSARQLPYANNNFVEIAPPRKIMKLFEHNIPPIDTWEENKDVSRGKIVSFPPENTSLTITSGTCDTIKSDPWDAVKDSKKPVPSHIEAALRKSRRGSGKLLREAVQEEVHSGNGYRARKENIQIKVKDADDGKDNTKRTRSERASSLRSSWRKKNLCSSPPAKPKSVAATARNKRKVPERVEYLGSPDSAQKKGGIRDKINRWREWDATHNQDELYLDAKFENNIPQTRNKRKNKKVKSPTRVKSPTTRVVVTRTILPEDFEVDEDGVFADEVANIPGWTTPEAFPEPPIRRAKARSPLRRNKRQRLANQLEQNDMYEWDTPGGEYGQYIDIDGNVEHFEEYQADENASISSLDCLETVPDVPRKRISGRMSGRMSSKRLNGKSSRWEDLGDEEENIESGRRWNSPVGKKRSTSAKARWGNGVRAKRR